jgi:ubiquinone/menaquinone biosynthesis C-methylase UbiE
MAIDRRDEEAMTSQLHPDKVEAIRQWNLDPCGAVDGLEPNTTGYWTKVDDERYASYASWMPDVFGFSRYPGKRVLEIGFGQGTDLMQFARGGSKVFGVDLTPRHVELTSLRFRAFDMKARLMFGDAEQLPFENESFDVVYSFGVLHHTPAMQKALDEVHRVLRPGGTAIISVYHKYSVVMAWKILVEGLLKRELFRDSWRQFMSKIEYRADPGSATPLVRVYSRGDLRRMFSRFRALHLSTHHTGLRALSKDQVNSTVTRLALRVLSDKALESRFGWYLVAKATK